MPLCRAFLEFVSQLRDLRRHVLDLVAREDDELVVLAPKCAELTLKLLNRLAVGRLLLGH